MRKKYLAFFIVILFVILTGCVATKSHPESAPEQPEQPAET